MSNTLYFLALNRIAGIGPRTVKKLLVRWPNLCELFALNRDEMVKQGLSEAMASRISQFPLATIDEDWAWAHMPQHHVLTWDSPHYPTLLKEIYDPPTVLYAKGDLKAFDAPSIAMIGSRKPSAQGAETARAFAKTLVQHGLCIISGLALGIDANAHQGALEGKGQTIAVMGTGIDCIYPYRHQKLAHDISEKGLLISEFPLKTLPKALHFPRRNRIISGLSMTILVVEAALKSGSLITARLAMEQNRDVMAIPSSIANPQARGCHHLLKQGAKLVTSCEDILEDMNLIARTHPHKEHHKMLAHQEDNLVKCVGFETTTIDQIALRSGLAVESVATGLTLLELEGVLKAVPGGYMRCV